VANDDFSTNRMIRNFSATAYPIYRTPIPEHTFFEHAILHHQLDQQLVDLAEVAHLTAESCALLFWVQLLALLRCTDCVDCQVSAMPFIAWTFVRGLCNCSPRAAGRVREAVLYF